MNSEKKMETANILTAEEVAEWLRVSPGWVYDHATRREPKIPAIKIGNGKGAVLRFDAQRVREWVEKWTKSE